MTQLAFRKNDPAVLPQGWRAKLSDGTLVYENRLPNRESAWKRLKKYLDKNQLTIDSLYFETIDQIIHLPDSELVDGYWMSYGVSATFSFPGEQKIISRQGIGYIQNNKIFVTWIVDDGTIKHEVKEFLPEKNLAGILNNSKGVGKSC